MDEDEEGAQVESERWVEPPLLPLEGVRRRRAERTFFSASCSRCFTERAESIIGGMEERFDSPLAETSREDAIADPFDAAATAEDARMVSTSPPRARSAGQQKPPTCVCCRNVRVQTEGSRDWAKSSSGADAYREGKRVVTGKKWFKH